MRNGIPRILIVRLSAIGDVVRVLPAVHCLRDAFPSAQIDFVVERKSFEVVEGHPALDRIWVLERTGSRAEYTRGFWRMGRKIRAARYDIVFDFHGILKSGLMSRISGARKRYGFGPPRSRDLSHFFANRRVSLGPEVVNRIHENLQLCSELSPGYNSLDIMLDIPDEFRRAIESYTDEVFDGDKWIVGMHIPVDRPEKQWPLEYYSELIDYLLADGRFEVGVTYGPGQEAMAKQAVADAQRKAVVIPEMESLKQYMAFIQYVDLYVGGDTGPMHIASALDTAVVAIFGGTHAAQHGPLGSPSVSLEADWVDQRRGVVTGSEAEKRLRSITPQKVYDACVSVMGGSTESKTT